MEHSKERENEVSPSAQAPRTYDWFKGHAFPRFYSRVRRSSVVPNPEYLTCSTFP